MYAAILPTMLIYMEFMHEKVTVFIKPASLSVESIICYVPVCVGAIANFIMLFIETFGLKNLFKADKYLRCNVLRFFQFVMLFRHSPSIDFISYL